MATYDSDVAIWAEEQAAHIRACRFDQLDLDHLADEILDVAKAERRELASRMAVLLTHHLKWQYLPSSRDPSWQRLAQIYRRQVKLRLDETPSLLSALQKPVWVEDVWSSAIIGAVESIDEFLPETCPWPLLDVLNPDWHPA